MSKIAYTLPITPFLKTFEEWRAFADDENGGTISFELAPRRKIELPDGTVTYKTEDLRIKDAFVLRERFFEIKTLHDALAFFQEFGPYQVDSYLGQAAKPVKLKAILHRRDFYSNALLHRSIGNLGRTYSADEMREFGENLYLWYPLPMELLFAQPMQAYVKCKDVEEALRASVFLDRLRGLPWQRCAREDCGRPFEIKNRHARLFCTPACAHLQSVRNYNAGKTQKQGNASTAKKGKGRKNANL